MNVNVKQGFMWSSQSNVTQLAEKKNSLGRKCFKWALAKRVIVGLLAIMLCILSHAQEVTKIGSYTDVQRRGNKYIDMVLTTVETLPFGWIYLEARGADGGRRSFHHDVSSPMTILPTGEKELHLGDGLRLKTTRKAAFLPDRRFGLS